MGEDMRDYSATLDRLTKLRKENEALQVSLRSVSERLRTAEALIAKFARHGGHGDECFTEEVSGVCYCGLSKAIGYSEALPEQRETPCYNGNHERKEDGICMTCKALGAEEKPNG
jgi:hypothetical protein